MISTCSWEASRSKGSEQVDDVRRTSEPRVEHASRPCLLYLLGFLKTLVDSRACAALEHI